MELGVVEPLQRGLSSQAGLASIQAASQENAQKILAVQPEISKFVVPSDPLTLKHEDENMLHGEACGKTVIPSCSSELLSQHFLDQSNQEQVNDRGRVH
ncbi:hypothetical protein TURU_018702 [Turdus rufiventris]|nr:hypothetical protein TURU_018702 [Turdus rufiventris]